MSAVAHIRIKLIGTSSNNTRHFSSWSRTASDVSGRRMISRRSKIIPSSCPSTGINCTRERLERHSCLVSLAIISIRLHKLNLVSKTKYQYQNVVQNAIRHNPLLSTIFVMPLISNFAHSDVKSDLETKMIAREFLDEKFNIGECLPYLSPLLP